MRGMAVGMAGVIGSVLAACATAPAAGPEPALPPEGPVAVFGTVEVTDRLLAERIGRLAERSATWRAALDTIARNEFPVLVTTPAGARELSPHLADFETPGLGEVLPLRDGTGAVRAAVVVVDLEALERLWRRTGEPRSVLLADIKRVLIHEIYGHVVPLSATRRVSGGCPDPEPGAPASSSCAMERENRIRAELGLEERVSYDITALAMGRVLLQDPRY
jgi:hypothetical protein